MAEFVPASPCLSEAQKLWLLELGLDRPMLARLAGTHSSGDAVARSVAQAPPSGLVAGQQGAAPEAETTSRPGVVAQTDDSRSQALAALAALRKSGGSPPAPSSSGALTPTAPEPSPASSPARGGLAPDATAWQALEAAIQACEACGLHVGRHAAVPGAGATESVDWLVVGEAPGGRDDGLGRPFQGTAGDLLHAMLTAAGIEPAHKVFYTNLVKCRPRSNRPPTPEEIAACQPHLLRQMEQLQPRGILALGRLAAQALLGEAASFEQYRGRIHAFKSGGLDIPVVVTYHPASLLSRPRHKAASWRDLNLARSLR